MLITFTQEVFLYNLKRCLNLECLLYSVEIWIHPQIKWSVKWWIIFLVNLWHRIGLVKWLVWIKVPMGHLFAFWTIKLLINTLKKLILLEQLMEVMDFIHQIQMQASNWRGLGKKHLGKDHRVWPNQVWACTEAQIESHHTSHTTCLMTPVEKLWMSISQC